MQEILDMINKDRRERLKETDNITMDETFCYNHNEIHPTKPNMDIVFSFSDCEYIGTIQCPQDLGMILVNKKKRKTPIYSYWHGSDGHIYRIKTNKSMVGGYAANDCFAFGMSGHAFLCEHKGLRAYENEDN